MSVSSLIQGRQDPQETAKALGNVAAATGGLGGDMEQLVSLLAGLSQGDTGALFRDDETVLPNTSDVAEAIGVEENALYQMFGLDPAGPLGDVLKAVSPLILAIARRAGKGDMPGVDIFQQPATKPGSKADKEAQGYYHEISGQSPNTPLVNKKPMRVAQPDMHRTVVPDPDQPKTPLEHRPLSSFEGDVLKASPWDRSEAGTLVTHIQGEELPIPIKTEGGIGHIETSPDVPIASHQQVISRYSDPQARAERLGGDKLIVAPSAMGHGGSNFNDHMLQGFLGMMVNRGFSADVLSDFVSDVNKRLKKAGKDPWDGLTPTGYEQLRASGDTRKAMYAESSMKKYRDMNFPDVDLVRYAQTAPDQLSMADRPLGTAGMGYAELTGKMVDVPHASYAKGMEGGPAGKTVDIPVEDMFYDWHQDRRRAGIPESEDNYTFGRSLPEQLVTEALVRQWERLGHKVD